MPVFNNILAGAAGSAGGAADFKIERSLRIDDVSNATLTRTPSTAGNRKTWTLSFWIKRTEIGGNQLLFNAGNTSNGDHSVMRFNGDMFQMYQYGHGGDTTAWSGGNGSQLRTSAKFRDPSAWMHIVVAMDTTQATQSDRLKYYINGVLQTEFDSTSYPAQDSNPGYWNAADLHCWGSQVQNTSPSGSADYYLADVYMVDGQQLAASDFGKFDEDTGVWNPIKYSGTYGTNGFHLDFSDNSSDSALGTDSSGNSNTWTVNNLSVASGIGNDSLLDSPTNYDDGTNVGGNYATLNPLHNGQTLSNGNLDVTGGSSWQRSVSTIAMSSGKWYWEYEITASNEHIIGVGPLDMQLSGNLGAGSPPGSGYGTELGQVNGTGANGSWTNTGGSSAGDCIGVAFDADAGKMYIYKNGTALNNGIPSHTGLTNGPYYAVFSLNGSSRSGTVNFGQRPFKYNNPGTNRPAATYLSLCTTNLPDPTIADPSTAFDTVLYAGDGNSTQTITGLSFAPDLTWQKIRNQAGDHGLTDSVRGVSAGYLQSEDTDAEKGNANNGVSAFNSDGFTVKGSFNTSSNNWVTWAWDAGDSNTTISAGGLNSSVYDQSRTWSGGTTSGSIFSGAWSQVFNNVETNTYSDGNSVYVYQNTATLNFATALPSGAIQIWGRAGSTGVSGDKVTFSDGTNTYTTGDLSNQTAEWIDVNSGSSLSGITSVTVHSGSSSGAGMVLGAIRIGGKKLVDSSVSVANVPSIASTTRANPTAGFSIVSYTGTGTANDSLGHGLNAAPELIITKNRDNATYSWRVLTTAIDGSLDRLFLDATNSKADQTGVNVPTSSVFYVGSNLDHNKSGDNIIAYCFAPVEGYSAFGSYTGNGSADGPFVPLNFRPALIIYKNIDSAYGWQIYDSTRDSFNICDNRLQPSSANAEDTTESFDMLSNGFKIRTSHARTNNSGDTFIFAAFASTPFKFARAR